MNIKTRKIKIGSVGSVHLDLNTVSIGKKGGKKAIILSGVHGNEITALVVLNNLINELQKNKEIIFKGELMIVTNTNPLAQAVNRREHPVGETTRDLNRSFPGNSKGDFTERLADKVFKLCQKADIVLDLHTFSDPTMIMGILMFTKDQELKNKQISIMHDFNPEVIWNLGDVSEYKGALGPVLIQNNILNFAVEMPESYLVSKEQVERATSGILRVLSRTGIVSGGVSAPKEGKEPQIVNKLDVTTIKSGLFVSDLKLGSKIKKGDLLGQIVSLDDLSKTSVFSDAAGILMIVKNNQMVSTGDRVCTLGVEIKE